MTKWDRRSVLATGVTVATGGLIASIGAADAELTEAESGELPDPDLDPNPEMDEDWASYRGDAGHARFIEDGYEFDGDSLETAWSTDHDGSVAVADDTVYTSTADSVVALDVVDGSVVWENTDIDPGTPTVVGETVYVSGDEVVALDRADGSVRWETDFDPEASSIDHTVAYDMVYVVVDGILYALDVDDGSIQWEIESVTVEPPHSDEEYDTEFVTDTAAANGVVYAGTEGAALAFEPETGDEVWREEVQFVNLASNRGIYATTTAVIVAATDVEQTIHDAQTGERIGMATTENADTALGTDVYVTGTDQTTYGSALEDDDYDYGWSISSEYNYDRPVISGETVYIYFDQAESVVQDGDEPAWGEYSDELVALDKYDGTEKWTLSGDDAPVGPIRAISGETMYVSHDGELVAMRPSDDPGEPGDEDWVDDFSDSDVGSEPDGWTSPTGSDFEGVDAPGRVGDTEVELTSGESAAHILEWDEAEEFEDGEIAAIYDASTATGNGHRLFLRTQNGRDDAYFLEPRPDTNELMIRRYAGGGLSTIETASKTLDETDGQLQARFRVKGDDLKGKAWNSGDDEPDGWDIETASTDVEGAGSPAIGTFNGPGERWSAVAAATGDETAPLPEIDDSDDEGGTVDRPADTRQILNQTGPSGVRVAVDEDISGLELTISEGTTGVDTAEIANAVGSPLETKDISGLGPGDSFEIEYDLEAGEEYIVLVYADDSYDRGDYDEPDWPYGGDQFQVVEGIWGRDNSTSGHFYAYTKLTAL